MKTMYRKTAMHMFADACSAPATQSVAMTMSTDRAARIYGTAVLAVSFLFRVLREIGALLVRPEVSRQAKP